MKLHHLILTLFSLLTSIALAADAEPGKAYVYKQSGGKPQEMEIYFPPNWEPAKNKVPGLIMFHGGGWGGGTLEQFRYACHYFASRGIVAATVNYQLASKKDAAPGQSRKRVCITDAKSAIRWFKQHAGELGIDPARIITGGGSAGGHICMLATNNPGLNDPADHKDIDTSVVAYLLFNPAFTADDAPDAEVDVLKHLSAKLPPAIMFFGTNDPWKKGSDVALKQLKDLGNTTTELWLAEGQSHSFFNRAPWQNLTISEADRFLVRHGLLSGEPTLPAPPKGEKIVKAP